MLSKRGGSPPTPIEPPPQRADARPRSGCSTASAIALLFAILCGGLLVETRQLRTRERALLRELSARAAPAAPCPETVVVAAATREAPVKKFSAVAVLCCFEAPEWMQRRYSAVVANALTVLPASAAVQVFHKAEAEGYARAVRVNPGLAKLRSDFPARLVFTAFPADAFAKVTKRSDLVLSRFLWTSAAADVVLFHGTGGAFCSNSAVSLNDFLGRPNAFVDGEGLLLVRRSDALGAIDAELAARKDGLAYVSGAHGPTGWLAKRVKAAGVADAADGAKRTFAAGADAPAGVVPFAITGTLARMATADRGALLERCPEAKLAFPPLHEPGCFGATSSLDADRCVASLCVASPKPGGC